MLELVIINAFKDNCIREIVRFLVSNYRFFGLGALCRCRTRKEIVASG
jgi:hypothetical protein